MAEVMLDNLISVLPRYEPPAPHSAGAGSDGNSSFDRHLDRFTSPASETPSRDSVSESSKPTSSTVSRTTDRREVRGDSDRPRSVDRRSTSSRPDDRTTSATNDHDSSPGDSTLAGTSTSSSSKSPAATEAKPGDTPDATDKSKDELPAADKAPEQDKQNAGEVPADSTAAQVLAVQLPMPAKVLPVQTPVVEDATAPPTIVAEIAKPGVEQPSTVKVPGVANGKSTLPAPQAAVAKLASAAAASAVAADVSTIPSGNDEGVKSTANSKSQTARPTAIEATPNLASVPATGTAPVLTAAVTTAAAATLAAPATRDQQPTPSNRQGKAGTQAAPSDNPPIPAASIDPTSQIAGAVPANASTPTEAVTTPIVAANLPLPPTVDTATVPSKGGGNQPLTELSTGGVSGNASPAGGAHAPPMNSVGEFHEFMSRLAPAADSADANTQSLSEVERARLVQRVANAFQNVSHEGGTLRLRLSPPELGSLLMEVNIRDGVLNARLSAETPQAQAVLVDNVAALRDRLADQGIKLGRFDVDLQQQPRGDSGGSAQQSPNGQDRGQADSSWGRRPRLEESAAVTTGRSSAVRSGVEGELDVTI